MKIICFKFGFKGSRFTGQGSLVKVHQSRFKVMVKVQAEVWHIYILQRLDKHPEQGSESEPNDEDELYLKFFPTKSLR